jgi:hypothetical protein
MENIPRLDNEKAVKNLFEFVPEFRENNEKFIC